MNIRAEQRADIQAVRCVHEAAFPTHDEAQLVDRLRDTGHAAISLVAEMDGNVVGHILFSPVTINGKHIGKGVGLAPLAVLPAFQKRGMGAALVNAGLDACRAGGHGFVVVLGNPKYYQRFGFGFADRLNLTSLYEAEYFMALLLRPDALLSLGGLVRYAPPFDELGAT